MTDELKKFAKNYGYDAQSRQLIEEMAELTQAINKFWRKQLLCGQRELSKVSFNNPEEKSIIEEIADVEICLEQIKYILVIEKEVEDFKKQKIDRQLTRMGVKENEQA